MSHYVKLEEKIEENVSILHSLILGQSTKTLKAGLSGLRNFQAVNKANNSISLLRAINKIAFKFEAHENMHVAMCSMKSQV